MKILFTNDDGIYSEGLLTLVKEFQDNTSHQLYICAPNIPCSGMSMALSIRKEIKVEKVDIFKDIVCFGVHGTPVDCIKLALYGIKEIPRPDLVISGINSGWNVGRDVYYSATVGAAIEAYFNKIPAVAISTLIYATQSIYRDIARYFIQEIENIYEKLKPCKAILNLNFPYPWKNFRITTISPYGYFRDVYYSDKNNVYVLNSTPNICRYSSKEDIRCVLEGDISYSYFIPTYTVREDV